METTNKVVRNDTVLDHINSEKANNPPDRMHRAVEDLILGNIVLTTYNNNTYSIEAIMWDMTPASTFDYRGSALSFAEYCKQRYGLQVTDMSQPLLQAKLSKKDMHRAAARGASTEIAPPAPILIPEFCKMTGLSDQMRSNFQLMKVLAEHLHAPPQKRVEGLLKFMKKMRGTPEVSHCSLYFSCRWNFGLFLTLSALFYRLKKN